MKTHSKKSVRFIVVSLLLFTVVLTAVVPVTTAQAKAKIDRQVFHDAMRKLWEDHITWTRLVIIGVFEDLPDLDPTVQRLLQNQVDIGDAIKPFYGEEAGDQLTALLTDHILIAAEILQAAKSGDPATLEDAIERWYANADDIAEFLNAANPNHWPLEEMRAMMREHLDLTLEEAVAYLNGDYEASIAAYDMVHLQALEMADMLSTGIIKQFPNKFK
jgi:alkanesulfonate monooxygenase SsuD/methylene tetrahydromethanopterin reductase-like flavin-dependent oxidoreductase (luciferase family)